MAILKVIELMSASKKSWDDAAQKMVDDASKTVKNIRSVYVENLSAKVVKNKITEYRLNGKVTFEIKN